ncbi:MAG: CGNR zinc finger domain-containing protein [Geminicoccaceae bacterium]
MTYGEGHPVRLVGGRLALDFLNTADWSSDGAVVHEKIGALADLDIWLEALGLSEVDRPGSEQAVYRFRRGLRALFLDQTRGDLAILEPHLRLIDIKNGRFGGKLRGQPLFALIAVSALSILSDPREQGRVKTCPGIDCGWMFVDETKNGRRKWCLMETCGNRAKASRHYQRISRTRADPGAK